MRWFAVGRSTNDDSRAAGMAAATGALEGHDDARLVICFASPRHELEGMLGGIREAAGEAPLIGCTTAGEIASAGPEDAAVVVAALGGDGFEVATAAAEDAAERLREAGAEAAASIGRLEAGKPHRALLLLTDGLAGDQQEIVRGAYSVAGATVPLVGGSAGDDLAMRQTHQLHGDRVLTGAVVAAAIGSDVPFGIGVRHGWQPVGEPMLVTRSERNRVLELDGRPALDAYCERLAVPDAARSDVSRFTRFAAEHPLGLVRREGEHHVRFVAAGDFEERSLVCIAAVPQGGLAWLMEGNADSVLEATDGACDDAFSTINGDEPVGVLAFDCIARRGVLGEEGIGEEISRITSNGHEVPVAGFYTYGEIARIRGVSGFHNQTLVVLAL